MGDAERARWVASDAGSAARRLHGKTSPSTVAAGLHSESSAGASGRALADLRATRLFVSGVDEGRAAVEADAVRKVYEAGLLAARAASGAADRVRAAELALALSDAVGHMHAALVEGRQPVPGMRAPRRPYASRPLAAADDASRVRLDVERALAASVAGAANELRGFVDAVELSRASDDVRQTSDAYDMLAAGPDGLPWYSLALYDIGRGVRELGGDVADLSARLPFVGARAVSGAMLAENSARMARLGERRLDHAAGEAVRLSAPRAALAAAAGGLAAAGDEAARARALFDADASKHERRVRGLKQGGF